MSTENKKFLIQKTCLSCKGLGFVEYISGLDIGLDSCPNCNGRGLVDIVDESIIKQIALSQGVDSTKCEICGKIEEKYKMVTRFGSKGLVCLDCAKAERK